MSPLTFHACSLAEVFPTLCDHYTKFVTHFYENSLVDHRGVYLSETCCSQIIHKPEKTELVFNWDHQVNIHIYNHKK